MNVTGFNDYQNKAVSTLATYGEDKDILNCSVRLSTEIANFLDTDSQEKGLNELGDCLWYTAVLSWLVGVKLDDLYMQAQQEYNTSLGRAKSAKTAVVLAAHNLKMAMDKYLYGKEVNVEGFTSNLGLVLLSLEALAAHSRVPILQVAEKNLDKLLPT